ncbi:Ank2, partial [Symbiodinium necroappetens]
MLVQDSPENHEGSINYFHAKGAHGALRDVWQSLSCNSSFPLCGAVLRWNFGNENVEALGHSFPEEAVEAIDGEAEDMEPEEGTAEAPDLAAAGELTAHQKALVKRMHDNMGHPDRLTFLRTARRARASPAVQKYIKEKFECE